ncbi:MAG: FtsX-like permease family protein [Bryobacteraceae bacterium]
MINKLVVENLKHRPVRTLLSVLAIAIEVTMILTLVGVSMGMLEDAERRAKGIGADIMIKPPGTSIISFSNGSMPEKLVEFFAKQPHVVIATGSISHGAGPMENASGIEFDQFSRMSGGFKFLSGGPFSGDADINIDERYARSKSLKTGSKFKLWDREWRVAGVFEQGKLSRIVLPLKTVQDLAGTPDKISQVFIKLDDPANTEQVVAAFKANPLLQGYPVVSLDEWVSLFSVDNIPALKPFIAVVITLGMVVGTLVVFLSMYTAVLERTREIGILKALGASPGYVLGILMRETALLAMVGAVLGIMMTYGTQWLVNTYAGPVLTQVIVPRWWPYTSILAVGSALLGTIYPGLKAVRQDALEALSYD